MDLPTAQLMPLLTAVGVLCLMALERLRPNRAYQADRGWVVRLSVLASVGIVATLLVGAWLDSVIPALNAARPPHALRAALTSLPAYLQGLLAYLVVTFFVYWWHRARHHSDTLWRWFHQVHHSTHRLQAVTAFYAHPTDFLGNLVIVTGVSYGLLGLGVDAAAWTAFWVGLFDVWEHTNVTTPRWLGFLIVRPEMHRVHHEKDRHQSNYGLPVWDLLFGTFENSRRSVECGFSPAQERQLMAMVRFKSVDSSGNAE